MHLKEKQTDRSLIKSSNAEGKDLQEIKSLKPLESSEVLIQRKIAKKY